jgi:hypothetical protein
MTITPWSFDGYEFPIGDAPERGKSGDWNREEKLIEQDPLMADVTLLKSWGFKSRRRKITGYCEQVTRDTLWAKWIAGTVGILIDGENRQIKCRITRADFNTINPVTELDANSDPVSTPLYTYSIEFVERT